MDDIGGDEARRKIIHAFIEPHMLCNFDGMGFGVIPEDVLISVGYDTKKDPFAGVGNKFGGTSAWWLNPNSATKCS